MSTDDDVPVTNMALTTEAELEAIAKSIGVDSLGGAFGFTQRMMAAVAAGAVGGNVPIPAGAPRGMDVSVYQATTPPLAGQDFLAVRATFATFADPKYLMHTANGRAAGVNLIAYHFLVGGEYRSIQSQVAAFLTASAGVDQKCVDFEFDQGYPYPTHAEVDAFIAGVQDAGFVCGKYDNLSNHFTGLESWHWAADPSGLFPTDSYAFRQWKSGAPGGDYFNGTSQQLEDFFMALPANLVIVQEELHTIHVPAGTEVFDTAGNARHPAASDQDEQSLYQVQVGGTGQVYWVVSKSLGQPQAVTLVRKDKVTDKGAVPLPDPAKQFTQADLDAAKTAGGAAGFLDAKTQASAAIAGLQPTGSSNA